MAYSIKQSASSVHKGATDFRIYNSSGSFVELSDYGCSIRQIRIQREDCNLNCDILFPLDKVNSKDIDHSIGTMVFEINSQTINTADKLWSIENFEENSITFVTQTVYEEFPVFFLAKISWMDHERLVIDFFVKSENIISPSATANILFTLGSKSGTDYVLKRYCEGVVYEDDFQNGNCNLFYSNAKGIHPMVEVISEEGGLSVSAYTTMPACAVSLSNILCPHITILQGNLPSLCNLFSPEQLPAGSVWNQRIIYGFDPIYRGPARVFPLGL